MLELATTVTFDRLFNELPKSVQRQAATKTDLSRVHPSHPSLGTETVRPKHDEAWSFLMDRAYRVIFTFLGPGQVELRFRRPHAKQNTSRSKMVPGTASYFSSSHA